MNTTSLAGVSGVGGSGGAGGTAGSGGNGGGGGGGGAGGYGAIVAGTGNTNSNKIMGGGGGNGGTGGTGAAGSANGTGGKGGDGGFGVTFNGAGVTFTNSGQVLGGTGGTGGAGAAGGSGGAGGIGVDFAGAGAASTLTNTGIIDGGFGGNAGNAGMATAGARGAGGVGVTGSNLTILNGGLIAGGMDGGNNGQAAAIDLTGGTNYLVIRQQQAGGLNETAAGINGAINVESGTLTIGTDAAGDQPDGSVTIMSNIVGAGKIFATGGFGNVLNLSGFNSYTGGTEVAGGTTLQINNAIYDGSNDELASSIGLGGLTLRDGSTLQVFPQTSFALKNTIGIDGSTTIDPDGTTLTLKGVISNAAPDATNANPAPGAIVTGSFGTLALQGANTYSGGTTIRGSTTVLVSNSTLTGAGAQQSSSIGTGTLTLDGGVLQSDPTAAPLTFAVPVNVTSNGGTIDPNGNTLTFTSTIQDSGGPVTFGQFNGGTVVLTGQNSYGGQTNIQRATLKAGASGALSSNSNYVDNGTLDLGGFDATIASLAGSGSVTTLGSNAPVTLTLNTAGTVTFAGVISDGAGTVAVVMNGTGTQVFSGSSSFYTGGTTVASGTLQLGHVSSTGTIDSAGSGPIAIDDGALLELATVGMLVNDLTIGSGAGTATVAATTGNAPTLMGGVTFGPGTATFGSAADTGTILFAPSSVTGAPSVLQVAGGTLRAGNGALGTVTANAGTTTQILGGATLDFNGNSAAVTMLQGAGTLTNAAGATTSIAAGSFSGTIAGGGAIAKTGTGTLTLTGASTYSGGTLLQGGTLQIGAATALGTGMLSMDENTTLAIVANNLTIANAVTFTGITDPTIDTGANFVTLSGAISGPGALTKIGTGTLDLTGTSTYSGATTVAQGTLLVDGSIANSAVTVANGATFGGPGRIGGLTVNTGGTAAPGLTRPYSTTPVSGNVVFQPGSTYQVQINAAGQTDSIAGTGTATLNGGTVNVLAANGTYSPATTYTILSAAGGRTGQFAALNDPNNFAFLTPSLQYTPTSVILTYASAAATPGAFAAVGATPNQIAAAGAIQGLGPGNALFNAVLVQTPAGARQAFAAASGEAHASAISVAAQDVRLFGNIVLDRLWNIASPNGGDAVDALGQFGSTTTPTLVRCYAPVEGQPDRPSNFVVWGQGIGSFGTLGGDGNASAVTQSLGGVALGIDGRIDAPQFSNWRVGLAGGYTSDDFSAKNGLGSGTYENVFGGLYAGARFGALDVRFGGSYGGSWTSVRRTVAFPGFAEAERSSYGGDTAQVFGELGYRFAVNRSVIEPVAGAAFTHVGTDGFRESGGAAALVGSSRSTDIGTTTLGFRGEAQLSAGLPVVARLFLAWQHAFGDVDPRSTVAFAAGSTPFTVSGAPLDRDSAVAEAGLEYRVTPAMTLALSYLGQIGPRDSQNAVKGRVDYRF